MSTSAPRLLPAFPESLALIARRSLEKLGVEVLLGSRVENITSAGVTVGGNQIKLWGAPAWWLWRIVHVGFLAGVRNRITTMINWFWAYLTFRGGIRLITGGDSLRERA